MLGQFALFRHRVALGLGEAQVVIRGQHIEIGHCDAQQQVLLGLGEIELGERDLTGAAAVLQPGLAAEHGLRQRDRNVLRTACLGTEQLLAVTRRRRAAAAGTDAALAAALATQRRRDGQLWQQRGTRQRPGLQGCLARCTRRAEIEVLRQGQLVALQQIEGVGGGRAGQQEQGEQEGAHESGGQAAEKGSRTITDAGRNG